MTATIEMPRYVSHKTVWALKIASIAYAPEPLPAGATCMLHFDDSSYAPREVSLDWITKRGAKAGGYFVVYEGDGYESWSPADAFERSHMIASDWGIQRAQEPKYGTDWRGRLVNRSTGVEIPDDEPLFVMRAKDRRSIAMLERYRDMVPAGDSATQEALRALIMKFAAFAHAHSDRMKDGDSKAPPPPVPHTINKPQPPRTEERPRASSWPFPTR